MYTYVYINTCIYICIHINTYIQEVQSGSRCVSRMIASVDGHETLMSPPHELASVTHALSLIDRSQVFLRLSCSLSCAAARVHARTHTRCFHLSLPLWCACTLPLCFCLFVSVSVCSSLFLSVSLSVYLSVCLSVCLSVHLSVRLTYTPFSLCNTHTHM